MGMPNTTDNNDRGQNLDEQYARGNQRARARKKKRRRDLALVGACLLAVVLLIVCIVMIVKEISGGGDGSSTAATGSQSVSDSISSDATGEGVSSENPDPEPTPPPKAENPAAWYLRIVNANAPLAASFAPTDGGELVTFTTSGHYIVADVKALLQQMIADCNAAGHALQVNSGYRSYNYQSSKYKEAYDANIAKGMTAEQAAAETAQLWDTPGTSEHQLGLSVDFVTGAYQHKGTDFDKTPEFAWLVDNAANYGFILRYPADKIHLTGTAYKPWHWRYVGVHDASIVSEAGICLEEYVGYDSTTPPTTDDNSEPELVISAGNKGY